MCEWKCDRLTVMQPMLRQTSPPKEVKEGEEPITRKEMNEMMDTQQKNQTMASAKQIASDMSDSPDEADAIMEIYKSRSFPSHLSLEKKMREAYLITNQDKLAGEKFELMRAAKSKQSSSSDASGTHQRQTHSSKAEKLPSDVKSEMVRLGWKFNNTAQRWEKTTSSGVILVRDPKTKKVTPIK